MLTYLLVFAAFVIVLSFPQSGGLPWTTLHTPVAIYGLVVGQVVLAGAVAWWYARAVRRKLDRDPAWLPGAQHLFATGTFATRVVLGVGLAASVYGTDWGANVRAWPAIRGLFGLSYLVMLVPFFVGILVVWVMLYPADRAIRRVQFDRQLQAGILHRQVWRLRTYLGYMFRQHVLIIAVPMVPIAIARDMIYDYRWKLRAWTHVPWGDQAVWGIVAGLIFFFAPVMLRFIWSTRVLPPGELREKLECISRRMGLKYRQILIWQSDGMVVNAAVMGLLRPVRYVMLSDGLMEMLDDHKIEAVFGHEAGHVKLHHIQFYLLFALLSMLIVGGTMELAMAAQRHWPAWFPPAGKFDDYLQVAAAAEIVLLWATFFGKVSRRFEWQADLFGAASVTPPAEGCDRPCIVHGTAKVAGEEDGVPVCATAATTFADALDRIAELNGISPEAGSWLHGSIGQRTRLLRGYVYQPASAARLVRTVRVIKGLLVVGVSIGLVIAAWLYWPRPVRRVRPGGVRVTAVQAGHLQGYVVVTSR
jgi:Zn-dependent protease with chaperone function